MSSTWSPPNFSRSAAGELERHDGLGHHRRRGDRRGVRALDQRLGGLVGVEPGRAQRRIRVGIGFIAIRTTIVSPFDMPPSMPPARFVSRW